MNQAGLDHDRIRELRELDPTGELLRALIASLQRAFAEGQAAMEAAVADGDAEKVLHVAHKLRSPAGTLGALGLSDLLTGIETRVANGGLPDREHLRLLDTEVERVLALLGQP